jgi:hypothetical protein
MRRQQQQQRARLPQAEAAGPSGADTRRAELGRAHIQATEAASRVLALMADMYSRVLLDDVHPNTPRTLRARSRAAMQEAARDDWLAVMHNVMHSIAPEAGATPRMHTTRDVQSAVTVARHEVLKAVRLTGPSPSKKTALKSPKPWPLEPVKKRRAVAMRPASRSRKGPPTDRTNTKTLDVPDPRLDMSSEELSRSIAKNMDRVMANLRERLKTLDKAPHGDVTSRALVPLGYFDTHKKARNRTPANVKGLLDLDCTGLSSHDCQVIAGLRRDAMGGFVISDNVIKESNLSNAGKEAARNMFTMARARMLVDELGEIKVDEIVRRVDQWADKDARSVEGEGIMADVLFGLRHIAGMDAQRSRRAYFLFKANQIHYDMRVVQPGRTRPPSEVVDRLAIFKTHLPWPIQYLVHTDKLKNAETDRKHTAIDRAEVLELIKRRSIDPNLIKDQVVHELKEAGVTASRNAYIIFKAFADPTNASLEPLARTLTWASWMSSWLPK